MPELFEGTTITIWSDTFEEEEEEMFTVRIGMTTVQMPKSVFLELHAGINESFKKTKLDKKLT